MIGHPDDKERQAGYVADIRETLEVHDRITRSGNFVFHDGGEEDDFRYVDLEIEIDGDEQAEDVQLDNVPL